MLDFTIKYLLALLMVILYTVDLIISRLINMLFNALKGNNPFYIIYMINNTHFRDGVGGELIGHPQKMISIIQFKAQ